MLVFDNTKLQIMTFIINSCSTHILTYFLIFIHDCWGEGVPNVSGIHILIYPKNKALNTH